MAMAVLREGEEQEQEFVAERECGEEIERDTVEMNEGKFGLEDLEEREEKERRAHEEDEEEVFSSGRGESEQGEEDKEEEVSSGVRVLFKKNPPSVIVQYDEDGEQVEFSRHDTSDQTESDSEEEEEEEEEDVEVEAGQEYMSDADCSLAVLLENATARTGVGALGGGDRSPGESSDGLYVVNDHDYYMSLAFEYPKLEDFRVNANRSTMVKLMAQSAMMMKLPPCGLYLSVLLLDFYWNHDRSMGRRMDSVQLYVLAFTCLYIASNRFATPSARTPDEFCRWAGVAEGSVKGCMIIRQLEAFEKLLQGPENVSSVTCQSLWDQMKQFPDRDSQYPELHMSNFIMELEQTDYGINYFNPPGAVKAAHAVWRSHARMMIAELNSPTNFEDRARAMERMLLLASMSAGKKRGAHEMAVESAADLNMNKRAKLVALPKIAVL